MNEPKMEKTVRDIFNMPHSEPGTEHPDEETLGAFVIGKLDIKESEAVTQHVIACLQCAESVALAIRLQSESGSPVPETVLEKVRANTCIAGKSAFLEIVLRLKEKALELLNSSGDVLTGQELIPAPVLRSRQKQEFPDSVTVLKDFQEVRVEARVERSAASTVNLSVRTLCLGSQSCLKDARVTLIKDSLELESYLAHAGAVTFEHLSSGIYRVDITSSRQQLAIIVLDLKN